MMEIERRNSLDDNSCCSGRSGEAHTREMRTRSKNTNPIIRKDDSFPMYPTGFNQSFLLNKGLNNNNSTESGKVSFNKEG